MNKIVLVVFALVAAAAAEPPVGGGYARSNPSNSYSAPSTSFRSSSNSDFGQETNEGAVLDEALLERIRQILIENESRSSSSSSGGFGGRSSNNGYSAPTNSYNAPSNSYSAPSNSYSAPQQTFSAPSSGYSAPSNSYGAPSSRSAGGFSSGIELGKPEIAMLISSFDLEDNVNTRSNQNSYAAPARNGGPY